MDGCHCIFHNLWWWGRVKRNVLNIVLGGTVHYHHYHDLQIVRRWTMNVHLTERRVFFFYIHKQSQIYIQELEGNLFHMITKVLLSNQHQSFHYASLICLCPQPFVFVLRRRGIGFYLYLVCFHFIKYSGGELANPHLGWSRDWAAAPHYTASRASNETSWKLLQYSEKALTFNN